MVKEVMLSGNINHYCPYCNGKLPTNIFNCNYCPVCGEKISFKLIREYHDLTSEECRYEDTDNRCTYSNTCCIDSTKCPYQNFKHSVFVLHHERIEAYNKYQDKIFEHNKQCDKNKKEEI